jgi:hypothetical protein
MVSQWFGAGLSAMNDPRGGLSIRQHDHFAEVGRVAVAA